MLQYEAELKVYRIRGLRESIFTVVSENNSIYLQILTNKREVKLHSLKKNASLML